MTLLNKEIQHQCLASSSDVENIFKPLFDFLGIHGISFFRYYNNENVIFLSNSKEWIENYFQKNYFSLHNHNLYTNFLHYTLWAQWPSDRKTSDLMRDAYNNFDYGNGLTICKKHTEYIDVFSLRGFARDSEINYKYFSHIETIDKFLDYFLATANNILTSATRFKIANNVIGDLKDQSPITESFLGLPSKLLHNKTGVPFLTRREQECIENLIKGKSAKEIARDLNISHRTIEQHFLNIKIKMCVTKKSEIIRDLFKIPYNKHILADSLIRD